MKGKNILHQLTSQSYSQMMSYIIETADDKIIVIDGGLPCDLDYLFSNIKRKYKTKPKARIFEYRNNSIINLGITEDNLINNYVTTRIIPVVNKPSGPSFSGRSTIHRSSSGRIHGGGGRKF